MNLRLILLIVVLVAGGSSASAQLFPSRQPYTKITDNLDGVTLPSQHAYTVYPGVPVEHAGEVETAVPPSNSSAEVAISAVANQDPMLLQPKEPVLGELASRLLPVSGSKEQAQIEISSLRPVRLEDKWTCSIPLDEKGRCRDNDQLGRILTAAVFGAQLSDYFTTRKALSTGAREANPIMAWPLKHEPLGISMKLGTAYLHSFLLMRLLRNPKPEVRKSSRLHAILSTAATLGIYTWVSKHNLGVARKLELKGAR